MKINIKKIIKILERASTTLASHIFLTCLLIVFLTLTFGALLFYKYVILIQNIEPEVSETFQLKEGVSRSILRFSDQEEQIFKQADSKEYFDIFRKVDIESE
jgi:hypothetical protein